MQEKLRGEILATTSEYSVEFSSVLVQLAVFMSFGSAWSLSAVALLLSMFAVAQMDVWKFNRVTQVSSGRPGTRGQLRA